MPEGFLTTHVLDTALGVPAAGMKVSLFHIEETKRTLIAQMSTNSDGRTDSQILPKESFAAGTYELIFEAGAYFDKIGLQLDAPKFLDVIPIRFGISDTDSHYHVPLLVSPFGYSTYRGS